MGEAELDTITGSGNSSDDQLRAILNATTQDDNATLATEVDNATTTIRWIEPYEDQNLIIIKGGLVDREFMRQLEHGKNYSVNGTIFVTGLNAADIDEDTLSRLVNIRHIKDGSLVFCYNINFINLRVFKGLQTINHTGVKYPPLVQIFNNRHLIDIRLPSLEKLRKSYEMETVVEIFTDSPVLWEHKNMYENLIRHKDQDTSLSVYQVGRKKETPSWTTANQIAEKYPVAIAHPYNRSAKACLLLDAKVDRFDLMFGNTDCVNFYGNLEISGKTVPPSIEKLETINGCLTIQGLEKKRLNMRRLRSISKSELLCPQNFTLRIYNNLKLEEIIFDENFSTSRTFVSGSRGSNRPKLTVSYLTKENSTKPLNRFNIGGSSEDCLVNHIDDKTGRKTYESHDCTVYLGEVRCMDLIGCNLNSENKVTSCSVRSGTVVFGQLVIEDTELTNVDFLMNVSIIGHQMPSLVIRNNLKLVNLDGLRKIRALGSGENAASKEVFLDGNAPVCTNDYTIREDLANTFELKLDYSTDCMTKCSGGVVTPETQENLVENIKNGCVVVTNGLTIRDYNSSTEEWKMLSKSLGNIQFIEGSFAFINNSGVSSMEFMKHLYQVENTASIEPIIRIEDNPNLTSVRILTLEKIKYDPKATRYGVVKITAYHHLVGLLRMSEVARGKVLFKLLPSKQTVETEKHPKYGGDDQLALGVTVVVVLMVGFAFVGYGAAYIVYEREKVELAKEEENAASLMKNSTPIPSASSLPPDEAVNPREVQLSKMKEVRMRRKYSTDSIY